MKFLCVTCDEVMALRRTDGPNDGSMTVVFQCPTCDREVAMLTNSMETQMVRALDVKLGGRSVPAEPMSVVKESLSGSRLGATSAASATATPSTRSGLTMAAGCPFSGVVSEAHDAVHGGTGGPGGTGGIVWTDDASERIERVPSYIRDMVRKGIEDYAIQQGRTEVDVTLMEEVRGRFGM